MQKFKTKTYIIIVLLIYNLSDYTMYTHLNTCASQWRNLVWHQIPLTWQNIHFFKLWITFDCSLGHSADWRYPPPPPQFAYAGPQQFSRPGMAYSLPPYRPMNGYMTYPTKAAYPVKVRICNTGWQSRKACSFKFNLVIWWNWLRVSQILINISISI